MRLIFLALITTLCTQAFSDGYGSSNTDHDHTVNMAHAHLGHVYLGWSTTPNKAGFLQTAIDEASIAKVHIDIALQQPDNLAWLKTHTSHVVHALDGKGEGPGLGYGLGKASKGIKKHVMLAAQSPGSSQAVQMHAIHVATSAQNVSTWNKDMLKVAKKVMNADNLEEALVNAKALQRGIDHMISGVDENQDGVVSWEKGEGGLEQANFHMDLILTAEGL